MPKKIAASVVVARKELTLEFNLWRGEQPGKLLVLHSHGMQDQHYSLEAETAFKDHPHVEVGPRSFAFVVPFDSAMNNGTFIADPKGMVPFVEQFAKQSPAFASAGVPDLSVYPYLNPINGLEPALDELHANTACDILQFTDIDPYVDYVPLAAVLAAKGDFVGGCPFNAYAGVLLLTCRSCAKRGIGMGGAPDVYPDGLYTQGGSSTPVVTIKEVSLA